MKLIASGVAICAGMTRSPSFSRSSSSTRMNMRPLRASSISSSGEERKPCRRRASSGLDMTKLLHAGKIAGEDVDFEVHLATRGQRVKIGLRVEVGLRRGVRNDVDPDPDAIGSILDLIDGQGYAIDGYRALGGEIAGERARRGNRNAPGVALARGRNNV